MKDRIFRIATAAALGLALAACDDGTVLDLSQLDFDPAAGGPVPELEVEIETAVDEGFVEIEIGG